MRSRLAVLTGSGQNGLPTGRTLLLWYEQYRRDLPWRGSLDPYSIWVSEVMLQQTRMEVVVPYWRRFLERFPTTAALARADEQAVRAAWSGLGYYRRATQLWRAAKIVVEQHQGKLPSAVDQLRRLPGIGEYTAGAISSIAFGKAEPAIDGNAERVLARLLGITADPRRGAARRRIREAVSSWLAGEDPAAVNQALMDFGAAVCKPRAPRCGPCPLASGCVALATASVKAIPFRRPRRRRVERSLLALWLEEGGRVLLHQRDATERLLPGTWQLPWIDEEVGAEGRNAERFAAQLGGAIELGEEIARLRHSITYRDLEVVVVRGRWRGRTEGTMRTGWFGAAELARLPHSSLLQKAWAEAAGRSAGSSGSEDVPTNDLVVDLTQPFGDETTEDLEQP